MVLSAVRRRSERNPTTHAAGQAQGEEVTLRDLSRAPRAYELMVILHPEVTEEDLPAAMDRVAGYIATLGGTVSEVLKDSPWGRRRLAYPIRFGGRDLRDGFYVVYHFEFTPNQVGELERELGLNDQVIRYLVTHYVPQPVDPRVVEQQEIDAEDAAAAAYLASQAEKARVAVAEAVIEAEVVEAVAEAVEEAIEEAEGE